MQTELRGGLVKTQTSPQSGEKCSLFTITEAFFFGVFAKRRLLCLQLGSVEVTLININ